MGRAKKNVTDEQRELILELNSIGAKTSTIMSATGLASSTITDLVKLYEAVEKENCEWLSRYLAPYYGGSCTSFAWVCKKLGRDQAELLRKIETIRTEKREPRKAETPPAQQAVGESKPQTTPFYIQQMLLNEAKIIELLEQLCDTVIPANMKVLRAENEKNIDLVCERMKLETDAIVTIMSETNKYLDNIRYNTRSDKKPRPAYIIEKGAANV